MCAWVWVWVCQWISCTALCLAVAVSMYMCARERVRVHALHVCVRARAHTHCVCILCVHARARARLFTSRLPALPHTPFLRSPSICLSLLSSSVLLRQASYRAIRTCSSIYQAPFPIELHTHTHIHTHTLALNHSLTHTHTQVFVVCVRTHMGWPMCLLYVVGVVGGRAGAGLRAGACVKERTLNLAAPRALGREEARTCSSTRAPAQQRQHAQCSCLDAGHALLAHRAPQHGQQTVRGTAYAQRRTRRAVQLLPTQNAGELTEPPASAPCSAQRRTRAAIVRLRRAQAYTARRDAPAQTPPRGERRRRSSTPENPAPAPPRPAAACSFCAPTNWHELVG